MRRGRDARGHRPERRRQDHLHQPARRQPAPDAGTDRLRRRGHHRPARAAARAQGARALVPDHQRLSRIQRAAQRRARGAGALRAQLPLLARRAQRPALLEPARSVLDEVGLGDRSRCPGGQPRARRAAPARGRDGARHAAAPAAARRADGRHGHRGIAAHDRAARLAQAQAHHHPGRARHGRGVHASPTASRCWCTAASSPPARPAEIRANAEVRTRLPGEEA